MRNLKKILALVLALMMVLSVMVTASAASPLEKYEDYESINPAYEQAVEVMTAAGVFEGNGTDFVPGRVLTRAEAATLISVLATGGNTTGIVKCETNFEDVAATHWASGFITYCFDNELIFGTSDTEYSPALELSYEQYAAMLLRVLKVDCSTTGKWYVPVRNNAVAKGLMKGIEGYVWTAGLTREAACQMTFNAMKAGSTTETTVIPAHYVVDVDGDKTEFPTAADAYFFAEANKGAGITVTVEYVKEAKTTKTTGMFETFKVKETYENDPYGAPAAKYVIGEGEKAVTLYYAEGEDFIYSAATLATTIATDLKGYTLAVNDTTSLKIEADTIAKFSNAATGIVTVDGEKKANLKEAAGLTQSVKPSAALAALTGDNTVVRIYTDSDKKITNIVVTNTYVEAAGAVTKASEDGKTPEKIKINGTDVVNIGLKEGQIVTYTLCNGVVENLAAAEYIVGTLSGWNSKGEYTINGTVYTLDGSAVVASAVQAQFGKAYAYYTGANNTIIYASAVPGTTPVAPVAPVADGYVMIVDAYYNDTIENKPTTDIWTGVNTNNYVGEVTVLVQALDNKGNLNAYALEVKQADDKHKTLTEGDYYVTIAGVDTKVCDVAGANEVYTSDTLAAALANTIYTYNAADGVINLLAKESILNYAGYAADYTGYAGTATQIDKTTLAFVNGYNANQAIVLMTDETVFIVKEYNEKNEFVGYKAVTGAAALQSTTIEAGSLMIVDVATDGKDAKNNVYTVSVVFGIKDTFKATGDTVAPTETLVYIDSNDYTVSGLDKDNKPVYTYNAISSEGTLVAVNSSVNTVETGIYVLNNDGSLGTNKTSSFTSAKIDSIAAGKYIIGKTILVATDDTTVIGGELVAGAEILYVVDKDNANAFDLVFVTKMPETK